MGTRGIFGVRINGQDKLAYSQFDSYPSGMGLKVLNDVKGFLKKKDGEKWLKDHARELRVIDGSTPPTPQDIKNLEHLTDLSVSEQSTSDWYCLTRNAQGDLKATLASGYLLDSHDFINDSLYCEWGYIVNLDEKTIEVYRGFQKHEHANGRYAANPPSSGYFPCALIATFPFDKLPTQKAFVKALESGDED